MIDEWPCTMNNEWWVTLHNDRWVTLHNDWWVTLHNDWWVTLYSFREWVTTSVVVWTETLDNKKNNIIENEQPDLESVINIFSVTHLITLAVSLTDHLHVSLSSRWHTLITTEHRSAYGEQNKIWEALKMFYFNRLSYRWINKFKLCMHI